MEKEAELIRFFQVQSPTVSRSSFKLMDYTKLGEGHTESLSLSLSLSHSFTHLKDVRLQKNGANEMQCLNPPNFRVDFVCTLAVSIHKISKSNSAEEKEIMMIRKSKIFMDHINKYFLLERSFKFLKMSIAMK